jgi:hypothetical protein
MSAGIEWYQFRYHHRRKEMKGKSFAGQRKSRKPRGRRTGGKFGLTIADAGAMVGLTRSASYRAAAAGHIPTIPAGRGSVVPKLIWLRLLGVEATVADLTEMPVTAHKTMEEVD